jgi:hypothetical protein
MTDLPLILPGVPPFASAQTCPLPPRWYRDRGIRGPGIFGEELRAVYGERDA